MGCDFDVLQFLLAALVSLFSAFGYTVLCSSFIFKHKIFVSFLYKWRAPLDSTLYLLSMQNAFTPGHIHLIYP